LEILEARMNVDPNVDPVLLAALQRALDIIALLKDELRDLEEAQA
jgi:hypothetical protein